MTLPKPPAHIDALKPYQPGRSIEEIREELGLERIIKLASNENPLGPSPAAVRAIGEAARDIHIYSRSGLALREALAEHYGIAADELIASAGSEGVLLTAMRSYLEPGDEVITAEGSFIGFYVIASAMNLDLKTVPLTPDYRYDLDAIAEAISERTRLVYIANPNNPTGTAVSRSQWHDFLAKLPDGLLVIMDEAYFDYAADLWEDYPDTVAERHEQVLTLRTFSKSYGLASSRVGYGVGHPQLIAPMLKVRLPFELAWPSEQGAIAALGDHEHLQRSLATNREQLGRMHRALERLGLPHTASVANFTLVTFDSAGQAAGFSDKLLHGGVIARPMVPFRLPHTVRITSGTAAEIDHLLELLETIVKP